LDSAIGFVPLHLTPHIIASHTDPDRAGAEREIQSNRLYIGLVGRKKLRNGNPLKAKLTE
jgi:hypothetical protein